MQLPVIEDFWIQTSEELYQILCHLFMLFKKCAPKANPNINNLNK